LEKLEGRGVMVFNAVGMQPYEAAEWGTYLKKICGEKGFKLLLLHDSNFLGLIKHIPLDWLSSPSSALQKAKNLIIFGEDLTDYIRIEELEKVFDGLEHLVVFSPFEDGIAQYAQIRIPMAMIGELEGTVETLMGEVKTRRFLQKAFNHTEFLRNLLDYIPEAEKEPVVLKGGPQQIRREVHLYRSNWITRRSENLTRLYEKNTAVMEVLRLGSS
ncbi:MAG: hydroxyacid dehydrogenase, partial [Aquificaceae bacterium]